MTNNFIVPENERVCRKMYILGWNLSYNPLSLVWGTLFRNIITHLDPCIQTTKWLNMIRKLISYNLKMNRGTREITQLVFCVCSSIITYVCKKISISENYTKLNVRKHVHIVITTNMDNNGKSLAAPVYGVINQFILGEMAVIFTSFGSINFLSARIFFREDIPIDSYFTQKICFCDGLTSPCLCRGIKG